MKATKVKRESFFQNKILRRVLQLPVKENFSQYFLIVRCDASGLATMEKELYFTGELSIFKVKLLA